MMQVVPQWPQRILCISSQVFWTAFIFWVSIRINADPGPYFFPVFFLLLHETSSSIDVRLIFNDLKLMNNIYIILIMKKNIFRDLSRPFGTINDFPRSETELWKRFRSQQPTHKVDIDPKRFEKNPTPRWANKLLFSYRVSHNWNYKGFRPPVAAKEA